MTSFQYLFEPIELGPLRVRNRLMMTAHGARLSHVRYIRYLEERARGGVGLIGIPAASGASVSPAFLGRFLPSYASDLDAVLPDPTTEEGIAFYDRAMVPGLGQYAEAIHRQGALCFGQIHNAGASRHDDNYQPAIAPSQVVDDFTREVPHELDEEEIHATVQALAYAALRIKKAGMDAVEIHSAHGYLIQQFLSPYSNRRKDQYGGSLEGRLRFLEEILAAIRELVGDDFPIGIRMNGDEFVEGGLSLEDYQQIAMSISDRVAYFNISGGSYAGLKDGLKLPYVAPWYIPLGPMVPFAAAIRSVVEVPVVVAGRINDPVLAEKILADGCADMVGMTRAFIADPEFANKAREGRIDDIRKCIADVECHWPAHPVVCTVNAAAGREEEMEIVPAETRKRVLVVGGGPAGMEAARVAALRGHAVTLCEQRAELGGTVAIITRDPNRGEMGDSIRYLQSQLPKVGVDVRLDTEVTPALVEELKPDAIVVATGSEPYVPTLPGVESGHVATALQVLSGEVEAGDGVLVVGGLEPHLAPPTVAEFLADQGKRVTLASELLMIGQGVEPSTLHLVTKRLLEKEITLLPLTGLRSIGDGSVVLYNVFTRREQRLEGIDTVVLACGSRAKTDLARSLKGRVKELHVVGDCNAPRRLIHAILEGSRVGRLI